MSFGSVWKKRQKKKERLRSHKAVLGEAVEIEVYHDPKLLELTLRDQPVIVFESKGYDVWFKPAGWLSQGTLFGDKHSVVRFSELGGEKNFLVHRLDREVSGLMVIAKHRKAAAFFSHEWSNSVKKYYQAESMGCFTSLEKKILTNPIDNKKAETKVQPVKLLTETTLLEIELISGRKHQIRKHLESIGHPVMGDPIYGKGNKNKTGLALVAHRLSFPCPDRGHKAIKIDLDQAYRIF